MPHPSLFPCTLLVATAIALNGVEAAKLATPDAMPVDPGSYEFALGIEWSRCRSSYDENGDLQERGGTLIERECSLGFTAGLVDNLDAGVTAGYARVTDGAADPDRGYGLTDVVIGAKWRCITADHLALALIPEISVPVGDGKPEQEICTGSNLWGAGLTFAVSADIDRLAIGAALSRGWVIGKDQDRGDARGCVGADLALGWQMTDAVQPEVELHYARDLNAGDTPDAWVLTTTAGVLVSTDLGRFGAGLDQAIAGKDADRATSILLQWVKGF